MNPSALRMLIIKHYKSQKNFADVLGIKPSNLSKRISQPTPRFLTQCKSAGLPVEEVLGPDSPSAADEINKLKERINQLQKALADKEKFISQQAKLIDILQGSKGTRKKK